MGTPVNAANFLSSILMPSQNLTPDGTAVFGLVGNMYNANATDNAGIIAVPIGTSVAFTLSPAQFAAGVLDISGTSGGAVALTTPTAAQIMSALPASIPKLGFNFMLYVMNDNIGQTLTLTAGTGVTVLGTATIATNTDRIYGVCCNFIAGTVTIINLGTLTL